MGLLEGKTALITGAARGIGKAIALKYASEGCNIAFTDLEVNLDTEKEIAALGVKAKSYASNAADFAQTEEVVKAVKEEFGSIDILVNNAGITKDGLMLRMTEQQWDAVIAVNLKSAFNFIHACVPVMMRQRGGSIINMASVVGVHGNAGQANYAASKAGLIALAKSIGQEMGPKGIRANAIAPGFIETAMTAALPDEVREQWKQKIPLRRGGQVEDIANVATFLASDLSVNEETEQEIAALGVKAKSYASNAADFAQTEEVVKAVKEEFGSIDILVNNAGITKDGLMLRMTEQQWDAVIAVNLKSAFNFIHACVPIMMRQRGGSIINMASVVGVHGNAGQANYAASKAGLIALAKSIGQEMGPKGIRANAIAPGFIDTAMTQALPDEVRKEWINKIPLRRGGQVEDIANVATFLASDLSSYVSGQVIQVDGGMNM